MKMLPLLFLISCAHNPYIINESGYTDSVVQCNLPIFFTINNSVPPKKREYIERAFDYWNNATDIRFFYSLGVTDYKPGGPENSISIVISVDDKNFISDDSCAITKYDYYANGCFKEVYVLIHPKCLKIENEYFESVMKHEAGHTLGLNHSDIFTDLMYPKLDKSMQHPIDASSEEIEDLMKLYGER